MFLWNKRCVYLGFPANQYSSASDVGRACAQYLSVFVSQRRVEYILKKRTLIGHEHTSRALRFELASINPLGNQETSSLAPTEAF